mgnify:CR=1 FL=1
MFYLNRHLNDYLNGQICERRSNQGNKFEILESKLNLLLIISINLITNIKDIMKMSMMLIANEKSMIVMFLGKVMYVINCIAKIVKTASIVSISIVGNIFTNSYY